MLTWLKVLKIISWAVSAISSFCLCWMSLKHTFIPYYCRCLFFVNFSWKIFIPNTKEWYYWSFDQFYTFVCKSFSFWFCLKLGYVFLYHYTSEDSGSTGNHRIIKAMEVSVLISICCHINKYIFCKRICIPTSVLRKSLPRKKHFFHFQNARYRSAVIIVQHCPLGYGF